MEIFYSGEICMKFQNLFSGKYKKNMTNLSTAEVAKRLVAVNKQQALH